MNGLINCDVNGVPQPKHMDIDFGSGASLKIVLTFYEF